jgi:DNA gyrase subunit B
MITGKKDRRYVHTEDQMQAILMDAGLAGAQLTMTPLSKISPEMKHAKEITEGESQLRDVVKGDQLRIMLELVSAIESGLRAFTRRNRSIRDFLHLAHPATDPVLDPRAGLLPQFLIEHDGQETPCWTEHECDDYRRMHNAEFESESEFNKRDKQSTDKGTQSYTPNLTGSSIQEQDLKKARRLELYEVKSLNKHLVRLRDEFHLRADVLLPHEVTGDEPPPRFILERDGDIHSLLDLRALVTAVRKIGEKGMKITRFKGLGEMDAEQLWETTMDPTRRTLLQVHLDDTAAANDLFATLMGDDVEPRRDFIEKHALEVKNLDV